MYWIELFLEFFPSIVKELHSELLHYNSYFSNVILWNFNYLTISSGLLILVRKSRHSRDTFGEKYSRMDRVKYGDDSLHTLSLQTI